MAAAAQCREEKKLQRKSAGGGEETEEERNAHAACENDGEISIIAKTIINGVILMAAASNNIEKQRGEENENINGSQLMAAKASQLKMAAASA